MEGAASARASRSRWTSERAGTGRRRSDGLPDVPAARIALGCVPVSSRRRPRSLAGARRRARAGAGAPARRGAARPRAPHARRGRVRSPALPGARRGAEARRAAEPAGSRDAPAARPHGRISSRRDGERRPFRSSRRSRALADAAPGARPRAGDSRPRRRADSRSRPGRRYVLELAISLEKAVFTAFTLEAAAARTTRSSPRRSATPPATRG